ncbi:FAD binding domain-containing protein [Acuticoccus sp. M5D2P5]|uniref:FAD binding domain-containing protein n=1 Tax=Acuticoccus kalidii TaxID=2910977 RepID=UPI001F316E8D|nr:FAD binding domain-containing protein [Acuticoccus kalidii]MCF3936234.1 FAD binding domain-containing protein [Acuticoccus kalidii]
MPIEVRTHATLAETARAFAASRGAHILGGGTVLMRAVNAADPSVATILRPADPVLRQIRTEGREIAIGAGVTMAEIIAHRELGFLAPVARLVGGPQVRTTATIGGNLFAAAPYGDVAGALLALGASVVTGEGRRMPLDDLFRPHAPRAFVATILVAPSRDFHFVKVSRVRPKGVSVMSIAANLPRPGGRLQDPRIVFNGMGARPMRAVAAERALSGQPLDAATIARAASLAAEGLAPEDDAIASAWYRREVAPVHLRRLLEGAA